MSSASLAATVTYSITDLGDLGHGGSAQPFAINDVGQVVGQARGAANDRPFLWENGAMTDLGELPGSIFSVARDISNNGQIVGTSIATVGLKGFLWENGTMTSLNLLPGATGSDAYSVNDAGQIVGISGSRAVRWDAGVVTEIGVGGARSINNSGDIVTNGTVFHEDGTTSQLGSLSSFYNQTNARSINGLGSVVGESRGANGNWQGFFWQNGSMTGTGTLTEFSSTELSAVNDSDVAVGHDRLSSQRAIVWDQINGLQDLNSLLDSSGDGWELLVARDINASGVIVGRGRNPNGSLRGFLLTPNVAAVPEPGHFVALTVIGFGGLLRRRKKLSV